MDLNPVDLDPSACIPHIPKTDLREMLKIYGDAPDTVSVSATTFSSPSRVGKPSVGGELVR